MHMASFIGRIVNMISGPNMGSVQVNDQSSPSPGQRGNCGSIQNDLHDFRTALMKAVSEDSARDVQLIVDVFVGLDVPLKEKFMALNVIDLLRKNSENLQGIKHIISGLGTIIKCARHLNKDVRPGQWGTVRFKNPHVQRKILPLKGFQQVLSQLGYTDLSADCQSFPADAIPDKENVVKLISDMELFRAELKTYCLGKHPHPESIGQYFSQELRDEVEEMQVKGLSTMEGSDGTADSSSAENTLAFQSQSTANNVKDSQEHQDTVDAFPHRPYQTQRKDSPSQGANSGRTSASSMLQKSSSPEFLSASSQSPGVGREESGSSETALIELREVPRTGNESSEIPRLLNSVEGLAIGEIAEMNNEPPVTTSSGTSDLSSSNTLICSVCGEEATFVCRECDYDQQMALCDQCNQSWHKHQNRRSHNPQRLSGCYNHLKSRLSNDSSGSGRGGLHIDADYGVTAYMRPQKKQQTVVSNAKDGSNWTQPQTNTYLTHNKNQVSPFAQQAEDYRYLEYQRQQGFVQQQPAQPQNFQQHQPYPPQLQQENQNLNYQQGYRPSNSYQQLAHPQMLPTSGQVFPLPVPPTPLPPATSGMYNNVPGPQRFVGAQSQLVSSSSIPYPQSQGIKNDLNRNAMMPPMMAGSASGISGPRFPMSQPMTGTYTVAAGHSQQPMLNTSPSVHQANPFMSMAAEDHNKMTQYQNSQDETALVPASLPPYVQRQILEEQNARQRLPYGLGQPWNGPQGVGYPYRLQQHLQEQTHYVGSPSGASNYGAPMSASERPYTPFQGQPENIPLTRLQPSLMSQARPQNFSQITPQQYAPSMPVEMMGNSATNPFLQETNTNMACALPKAYENINELEHSGYPSQTKTPIPDNRYPAFADPSLTNFMCNQNLQPPLTPQTPLLSSSSLLSSPSTSATPSHYVRRLLAENNLGQRKALCEAYIDNLRQDRQNLEEAMENKMEEIQNFSNTQECQDMLRRKEEMVKEKRALHRFLKQLDMQINTFYNGAKGGFGDQHQEIYYPPEVGTGGPSKALPANLPTVAGGIGESEEEARTHSQNSPASDLTALGKSHNVINTWAAESAAVGNIGLTYGKAPFESTLSRSRVPVEDSICDPQEPLAVQIPPALPPRSTKPVAGKTNDTKSILDMTLPAPEIKDSPPLPKRMWECEHCTFLNSATVHICQMCDRTSDNAKIIETASEEIDMPQESKGVDEDLENISEELDKNPFLDILKEMKEDGAKQKNLFDEEEEDEEFVDIFDYDPSEKQQNGVYHIKGTTDRNTGDNVPNFIKGSQEQVMEEKKRAKLEFEHKEKLRLQHQILSSKNASSNFKETEAISSGNASGQTEVSSGARPKQSTRKPNPSSAKEPVALTNASNSSEQPLVTLENSLARMEEMKAIESMHTSGAQLIKLIKQADAENFDVQAVQIAIEICESLKGTTTALEPLAWLRENWQKNVSKIASSAQAKGADLSPNDVGEVSFAEAERAYISCQGNMKEAVEKCVLDRQTLYAELSAINESFAREDILSAMMASEGDRSAAKAKLEQAILQPFETRVWQEPQQQTSDSFDGSAGATANQTAGQAGVSNVRIGAAVGIAAVGTTLALAPRSEHVAKAAVGLASMVYRGAQARGSGDDVQNNNAAVGNAGIDGGEDVGVVFGPNGGESMAAYNPLLSLSTSIIGHKMFQDMMQDQSVDFERRVRMIYVEGRLHSWGRADMVVRILDEEKELQADLAEGSVTLEDVVEAVRDCQDRASALAYLRQECQICYSHFPMNKIMSLNICQCRLCQECMIAHFEVVIKEKHVRHWVCPQCSQPDLTDPEVASNYLQFLGMQLQAIVSRELQDLFETKTRDWHLQKMEHFRWCAHCAAGFLADNRQGQLRMTCPQCGERTCYACKRQWEDQHEGLTCEEFSQWKVDNDPNNQSVGLAKHLDENGIDCPNCKMRFDLAKGGCMHFKCPQCGHEFCSGCNEPYHHKNMCTKYKACKNLGLHCHCPRDCFSFLRDYVVTDLQRLLKDHQIAFNIAAPPDQADPGHCPVMEQKEFDLQRHRDEKCGRNALEGGAGLCENHYKEYLAMLINARGLDPVILMTKEQMEALLKRFDVATPCSPRGTSPGAYRTSLVQLVTRHLPLRKRKT